MPLYTLAAGHEQGVRVVRAISKCNGLHFPFNHISRVWMNKARFRLGKV